jgi:hypothetical protein
MIKLLRTFSATAWYGVRHRPPHAYYTVSAIGIYTVPGKSPAPVQPHPEVEHKFDRLEAISMMSAAEIRNATMQSMTSDVRLRLMIIGVTAWAAFQIIRLVAVFLMQDALSGSASPAWLYPAITDVVVGLMAPIVAFAVWRLKGLGVWVFAIVFFAISIVDHLDAVTAALTTPIPAAPLLSPSPVATTVDLVLISVIDAVAIAVLATARMRSYLHIPQ